MAVNPMTRAQFPRELEEGLNTIFGMVYNQHPDEWATLYEKNRTEKSWEEDVMRYGLGYAPDKTEGAGVEYDSGGEGWNVIYRIGTVALAFSLTEEAGEDNLYGDLGRDFSASLARSFKATKEVKAAAVFNSATDATAGSKGLGGDGVSLLSTAHPLANGQTFSNLLNPVAQLSEAALEDFFTLLAGWEDERGIPILVRPVSLNVHPSNIFNATRIVKNPDRPGTADRDINALNQLGMLPGGINQFHYWTDPEMWLIKTNVEKGGRYFEKVSLKTDMKEDFNSGNLRYKGRERYVFGFTNPRFVGGSTG